jgi:hypothetical protein
MSVGVEIDGEAVTDIATTVGMRYNEFWDVDETKHCQICFAGADTKEASVQAAIDCLSQYNVSVIEEFTENAYPNLILRTGESWGLDLDYYSIYDMRGSLQWTGTGDGSDIMLPRGVYLVKPDNSISTSAVFTPFLISLID